jgi:putative PIN family toxin of toxin-antitoxin system
MPRKKFRVVIDTNIWVSFLIGKVLSGLEDLIIDNRIQLLLSDELLEEMNDVLHRPKFQRYFTVDVINELVSLMLGKVEMVEIKETFDVCRDPKDDFLLDLCVSGKADYLVTGDEDLLALNPFKGTQVIDYNSFQNILKKL